MSNYDPRDILVLCESIMEDGELTYDELYRLAEWLNNHQEACSNWPGSLLVAPLQKAWADGKVTKTEARQVVPLPERVTLPAEGRYPDASFDGFLIRGARAVACRVVPIRGVSDHFPAILTIAPE